MARHPCPTCGDPADPSPTNPERPFCSARCREVDLYRWLSEDYRVPGPPALLDDVRHTLRDDDPDR